MMELFYLGRNRWEMFDGLDFLRVEYAFDQNNNDWPECKTLTFSKLGWAEDAERYPFSKEKEGCTAWFGRQSLYFPPRSPTQKQDKLMLRFFELACQADETGMLGPVKGMDKVMHSVLSSKLFEDSGFTPGTIRPCPKGAAHALLVSLARHLDPNLKWPSGKSLLHIAAQYGETDIVDILLRRGANPKLKTLFLKTPKEYLDRYKSKVAKASKQPAKDKGR